jgi:hypothetical protein
VYRLTGTPPPDYLNLRAAWLQLARDIGVRGTLDTDLYREVAREIAGPTRARETTATASGIRVPADKRRQRRR